MAVKFTTAGGATLTYGKDRREIHLKPGKYGIELAERERRVEALHDALTISSGDNRTVEVFREKETAPPKEMPTIAAVAPFAHRIQDSPGDRDKRYMEGRGGRTVQERGAPEHRLWRQHLDRLQVRLRSNGSIGSAEHGMVVRSQWSRGLRFSSSSAWAIRRPRRPMMRGKIRQATPRCPRRLQQGASGTA